MGVFYLQLVDTEPRIFCMQTMYSSTEIQIHLSSQIMKDGEKNFKSWKNPKYVFYLLMLGDELACCTYFVAWVEEHCLSVP